MTTIFNKFKTHYQGLEKKIMKKTALAAALLVASGGVNAAAITSLTVTGGNFFMGFGGPITPTAFANMSVDGSYDGTAPPGGTGSEASYAASSIGTFIFGGFGPVAIYTQQTDSAGNGPFPGVTGDLTGNALTLDLRSWTAWWNGTDFNQGAGGVTATTDGAGNFTATWTALVVGGPFNGQIGNWTLNGTAAAAGPVIPIPAAAWLFGSGLLGLVGVARRRRAA